MGQSEYDSFQAMLYKRLSAGLNFSVAYTNSKTLEKVSYANAQDTQLLKQVAAWEDQFLRFMREQRSEVRNTMLKERKLSQAVEQQLAAAIQAFQPQFKALADGKV